MFRFFSRSRPGLISRYYRPQLMCLEDRIVPSTITVDINNSYQAAYNVAKAGDTIQIEPSANIQLSQDATLAAAASAGDTQITVTKTMANDIFAGEVIDLGGGDNNVLVDNDAPQPGGNDVLTLHTALTSSHAKDETVTPVPDTLGIGLPLTLEGVSSDGKSPLTFAFPSGFSLQLFAANNNTGPVTLQNLALSVGANAYAIFGATAGDLNINQDQITVNGDNSYGISTQVGGSETITGSQINVTGSSGYGNNASVTGNLAITGSTITVNGAESYGDSSEVGGDETVTNSTIVAIGSNVYGISSDMGGNETLSHSLIFVSGDGSYGNNAVVSGALTIANSIFHLGGNNSYAENAQVGDAILISNSLFRMEGDGDYAINDFGRGTDTMTDNIINITGQGTDNGNDYGINSESAGAFLLSGNSIRILNNPGVGVSWQSISGSPQAGIPTSGESILNNVISTGGLGTGLIILPSQLAEAEFTAGISQQGAAGALVQGNDFRGNLIGVQIVGDGNSAGIVDLGSPLGSMGGNDFRGYPANGAGGSFAISLTNTNDEASVSAQNNIWDLDSQGNVIDPHTVIQDGSNNTGKTGTGIIDVGTSQMSANQEFVQTLYRVLLGRVGKLDQTEVNAWAALVPTRGTEAVVQGIIHDPGHEFYRHLVDGYYLQFLGRPADSGGENAWVNAFLSAATEEQVITGFLTSVEFTQKDMFLASTGNSDTGFVQALYSLLLHRDVAEGTLSTSGITSGLNLLDNTFGGDRSALVQYILGNSNNLTSGTDFKTVDGSTFRQAAVRSFFGDSTLTPLPFQFFLPDLLNRTQVSSAEVNGWAGSAKDLLNLEAAILGDSGGEFFRHG